ncbi:FecCD family ABC transporter permease [Brevundimonas halotolerans]|uniref:Iron complex transport system permease protein n=1 Tax=Brevundimonas halotolerans TaxID=69670 RepID=A0A7W9A3Q1_9CAUL|nr:iron ABC transporter permease [Brevundimonas halotolerans]MBB5660871.1 iron complex transport system permease protein [Brevundimonas halotolerans]
MTVARINLMLAVALAVALIAALTLGEVGLSGAQYAQAFSDPGSGPGLILWQVRAPRAICAVAVGAALGLSGALMQGLLRNPLAEPGVLGVSATASLGGALVLVAGAGMVTGAVELAAMAGAGIGAAALVAFAARIRAPEALILFGVALSSFAGAATALIFNLSPSPIATAEVMAWLLGSVQNRGWADVLWVSAALVPAGILAGLSAPGLKALSLGDETARTLGLPLDRLRLLALLAASLAAGAAVATAGVIGFVGLVAPHLVRASVRADPGRVLLPSALAGGLILVVADLMTRITPTDQELKLGVFTALVGAPLFALIAWRAARAWRV